MEIKLNHIFNRFDVKSQNKEEIFSGDTYPEIFKKIYEYKRSYRYCNDGFKFINKDDEIAYNNWYKNLSEIEKFNLYYGTGIIN